MVFQFRDAYILKRSHFKINVGGRLLEIDRACFSSFVYGGVGLYQTQDGYVMYYVKSA